MSTGPEIDLALAFLDAAQRPSGQFGLLMGADLNDPAVPSIRDSTPFGTALILHCLSFSTDARADAMAARALAFLAREMEPGGVWRYWTAEHDLHHTIPPDLDDTACAAEILRRHGAPVPDHRDLLLACRDTRGLFYTWITPRWRRPPLSRAFWRIALQRYRTPLTHLLFWWMNESGRYDVDGIVNANVLFALGESAETAPVVDHLIDVIRRGNEAACDKWHLNAFTFHYMTARAFAAGATGLSPVRGEAVARVLTHRNADGSFGASALDTALAACALLSWDAEPDAVARAAAHLRSTQHADGGWPTVPMYWGGPKRYWGWGSRELTTAYCLEALLRCPAT